MSKISKSAAVFIEYLWLIFFILSTSLGIYYTIVSGIEISYKLFIISFVSLLMYFIRRYIRKNNKNL